MNFSKNLIISLTFLSFCCTKTFAMCPLLEKSSSFFVKRKPPSILQKRFLTNTLDIDANMKKYENKILETPIVPKNKPKSYNLPENFFIENRKNITLDNVNERIFHVHRDINMEREFMEKEKSINIYIENNNKILETPVIPKNKPKSYNLPENFFIENQKDITLDSINERIFHVHRNINMERESLVNIDSEEEGENKQFALFKEEDGKIIDRRVIVEDPLSPQYLPICYLRGSYKLSDQDTLFYAGSGFRNTLNQIVTAGHNLSIDEKDVKKYFDRKKMPLPQKFLFDPKFLTMQIIFGYRTEKGQLQYVHLSEVNGRHCFSHDIRDLGIIQLPHSQKTFLDNDIGGLPTMFFPDQPHEYFSQNITIVGYPGEIKPPSLHSHSGPIKNVDPGKVVFYDIDTTKGNSGSPGLNGVKNGNNIIPVFLTHTHNVKESSINAGQGYDQDFYDFMFMCAKETSN